MSKRKNILVNVKKMTYNELISFRAATKRVSALFSIAGVMIILGILFFMNIFTLMAGGLLVYILAKLSMTTGFIQLEISNAIKRLET